MRMLRFLGLWLVGLVMACGCGPGQVPDEWPTEQPGFAIWDEEYTYEAIPEGAVTYHLDNSIRFYNLSADPVEMVTQLDGRGAVEVVEGLPTDPVVGEGYPIKLDFTLPTEPEGDGASTIRTYVSQGNNLLGQWTAVLTYHLDPTPSPQQ